MVVGLVLGAVLVETSIVNAGVFESGEWYYRRFTMYATLVQVGSY